MIDDFDDASVVASCCEVTCSPVVVPFAVPAALAVVAAAVAVVAAAAAYEPLSCAACNLPRSVFNSSSASAMLWHGAFLILGTPGLLEAASS